MYYSTLCVICTVEENRMHSFNINIRSFRQVQEFVSLAMVQPFDVLVGNDKQEVNAKGFIGMFSLDYHNPVRVSVRCSDEEFDRFQCAAAQFIV